MEKTVKITVFIFVLMLALSAAALVGCKTAETYTLLYTVIDGGYIDGFKTQQVQHGGDGTSVQAYPYTGYDFLQWSDGVTTPERHDLNVQGNISVVAQFGKSVRTVNYAVKEGGFIEGETQQNLTKEKTGTQVTAVPYEGYEFVKWSDGFTEPTRTDVFEWSKPDRTFYAEFEKITLYIRYTGGQFCFEDGTPLYGAPVKVKYGEDSVPVKVVVGESDYLFVRWSDGETSPVRSEKNVTQDMTITAHFGSLTAYTVGGKGGKIVGETSQLLLPDEERTPVTAVPDEGYIFNGWSDFNCNTERLDSVVKWRKAEFAAFFTPVKKTFKYNYGKEYGAPPLNDVTVTRDGLSDTRFILPSLEGYKFCGWYSDGDYSLKVVNENGLNMLGNYVFELESDVLYAKWRKESEAEPLTHKILLVFIDKLNADLVSKNGDKIEFRHQMCGIDYRYADLVQRGMRLNLNEWFKDYKVAIRFEVDMYFTQNPVTEEAFFVSDNLGVCVDEYRFTELVPLYKNYHNVLFGLNLIEDNEFEIHSSGGSSGVKFGQINIDSYLKIHLNNNCENLREDEELMLSLTSRKPNLLEAYLHEFVHTCEHNFLKDTDAGEMLQYHDVYFYYCIHLNMGLNEGTRLYLLGEAEYEGKIGGIPIDYWLNQFEVEVVYSYFIIDGGGQGKP